MDPGGDDSQSYFAAASPPKTGGLDDQVAELRKLQQSILAGRQSGSPSRGPLLQQPQPIIPATGAAPYMYVDPRARQYDPMSAYPDDLQKVNDQVLLRKLQLLPQNTPNILMKSGLGNAPRYADDRRDLNDMLNSAPETQFLGKPRPTPTPTTTPHYFPVSYFT